MSRLWWKLARVINYNYAKLIHTIDYLIMDFDPERAAKNFLELASEQRLRILLQLLHSKTKLSDMARKLDATAPEVKRNFDRLLGRKLIQKDSEGKYSLTTYGKAVLEQFPSLVFLDKNNKYFQDHDYGDIPPKFIMRVGQLMNNHLVEGFVKVQESWLKIYKNANEYIYNILSEVSYTDENIKELFGKLEKKIKIKSIFSETAIIPEKRKTVLKKFNFKKFIEEGDFARKMKKRVIVSIVLSEKDAGIMFTKENNVDMSKMFYSSDPQFHDWCLDYFNYCWHESGIFQERKLNG